MEKIELEKFFFKAALATYAGKAAKETIDELPGSKVYSFQQADLLYKDVYFSNGPKSGGQTIIFHNTGEGYKAVWLMQYNGYEDDDNPHIIALLKEALKKAYGETKFYGGRGPGQFDQPEIPYTYKNDFSGNFNEFYGKETIHNINDDIIFVHDYSGRSLIELS